MAGLILCAAGTAATYAAAPAQGADILTLLGYLGLFAVLMILMVWLPQRRKDKKTRELLASIKVGDGVTTHSGVLGKVVNIRDDVITVQTGIERTQIDFKKWAIKDVEKVLEA